MRCSAKLWKNSLCIAFFLIPTLGKSGRTFFLMKIQAVSVRTRYFVHLILPWIRKQTRPNSTRDFQKDWNWKTMLCQLYWICFYYVITIALSCLLNTVPFLGIGKLGTLKYDCRPHWIPQHHWARVLSFWRCLYATGSERCQLLPKFAFGFGALNNAIISMGSVRILAR